MHLRPWNKVCVVNIVALVQFEEDCEKHVVMKMVLVLEAIEFYGSLAAPLAFLLQIVIRLNIASRILLMRAGIDGTYL